MGEESPCRRAYEDWCGEGGARQSWDPLTLLAAVRGPAGAGCVEEGSGGRNSVDQEGNNSWRDAALNGTSQSFLVMTVRMLGGRREVETELQDPDRARQVIDGLLCDQ